jgi:hypothetical protein
MTRERVRTLLSAAQGEAVPTFLSLLDDPTADVHPDAEEHSNSTVRTAAAHQYHPV